MSMTHNPIPPTEIRRKKAMVRGTSDLVERFFAAPEPVRSDKKRMGVFIRRFGNCLFLLAFALVGGKACLSYKCSITARFRRKRRSNIKPKFPSKATRRELIRDRNGIILAANAYVVKVCGRSQKPFNIAISVLPRSFQRPSGKPTGNIIRRSLADTSAPVYRC